MENSEAFLAALVGVTKLGAVAGLVNTNQRKKVLAHSIQLIKPKIIVIDKEHLGVFSEVRDIASIRKIAVICIPGTELSETPHWAFEYHARMDLQGVSDPKETDWVKLKDPCFYLFTSGTTALPKAAVVSNERLFRGMQGYGKICLNLQPKDKLYNCLPLYHATGLIVGFGSVAYAGARMYLRKKFSATAFLREVRRENTNVFIYVGELCRYLIALDKNVNDSSNPITKVVGNGLRPDIWKEFKARFGIPEVYELYGASEGNAGFVNAFNKDETIGFGITPHILVRTDQETEEIIRNDEGVCEVVKRGEVGLLLTEVSQNARFDGYTDSIESKKKLITRVLVEGDLYFNTGDLIRQVDVGFTFWKPHYQFVDRTGDTFRWKGENCSTNEIESILNGLEEVAFSNVYGVSVPGAEGRAGMAAVALSSTEGAPDAVDWKSFYGRISDELPKYAVPVFLRIVKEQPRTSTFKLQKGSLRREAYHLGEGHGDPLFVAKPGLRSYVPLDAEFYETVCEGRSGL